jgi:hypothetical protein
LTARTVIVLLPTLTGDEPVWLTLVGQRALRGEMVDDRPAEHAAAEQVV